MSQAEQLRRGMEALRRSSGVTLAEVAAHMRRVSHANTVSLREFAEAFTQPSPRSDSEWERRCRESQERSDARRGLSPHPWPRRGHVLATFAVASIAIFLCWLFLWASAADFQ